MPETSREKAGRMRTPQGSLKRLHEDHGALGLRVRRVHDFRRTMISLARSNGESKEILKRATHQPDADVIEGYTTFEWEAGCAENGKISLAPREDHERKKDKATRVWAKGFATTLLPRATKPPNP